MNYLSGECVKCFLNKWIRLVQTNCAHRTSDHGTVRLQLSPLIILTVVMRLVRGLLTNNTHEPFPRKDRWTQPATNVTVNAAFIYEQLVK
jgi:hypothetical protein